MASWKDKLPVSVDVSPHDPCASAGQRQAWMMSYFAYLDSRVTPSVFENMMRVAEAKVCIMSYGHGEERVRTSRFVQRVHGMCWSAFCEFAFPTSRHALTIAVLDYYNQIDVPEWPFPALNLSQADLEAEPASPVYADWLLKHADLKRGDVARAIKGEDPELQAQLASDLKKLSLGSSPARPRRTGIETSIWANAPDSAPSASADKGKAPAKADKVQAEREALAAAWGRTLPPAPPVEEGRRQPSAAMLRAREALRNAEAAKASQTGPAPKSETSQGRKAQQKPASGGKEEASASSGKGRSVSSKTPAASAKGRATSTQGQGGSSTKPKGASKAKDPARTAPPPAPAPQEVQPLDPVTPTVDLKRLRELHDFEAMVWMNLILEAGVADFIGHAPFTGQLELTFPSGFMPGFLRNEAFNRRICEELPGVSHEVDNDEHGLCRLRLKVDPSFRGQIRGNELLKSRLRQYWLMMVSWINGIFECWLCHEPIVPLYRWVDLERCTMECGFRGPAVRELHLAVLDKAAELWPRNQPSEN
ncbi:hypothetical protein HJFPF1_02372 [Paramyrothecium foliicola]|nr:hypothetical protein HJFPF1_02372 [Paramyrothecium foliicola]